ALRTRRAPGDPSGLSTCRKPDAAISPVHPACSYGVTVLLQIRERWESAVKALFQELAAEFPQAPVGLKHLMREEAAAAHVRCDTTQIEDLPKTESVPQPIRTERWRANKYRCGRQPQPKIIAPDSNMRPFPPWNRFA